MAPDDGSIESGEGAPGTIRLVAPQLEIVWPDGRQETVTLLREVTRIGRLSGENDVVAPAELNSVSRRHLDLRRQGEQIVLVDLGTVNGVDVNGERVSESRALADEDIVTFGSAESGQLVRAVYRAGSLGLFGKPAVGETRPVSPVTGETPAGPHLRVRTSNGETWFWALAAERTVVGRDPGTDLVVPRGLGYVSGRHCEIRRALGGETTVVDLHSTNGTWLNGQRLAPGEPARLSDGAVLRIGDETLGASLGLYFADPTTREPALGGLAATQILGPQLVAQRRMLIGRASDCDLVLSGPQVSRRHAAIEPSGAAYRLLDLGSANGTFLNDARISQGELHDGDRIQIQEHVLVFRDGQVTPYDSQGARLDVIGLSQEIAGRGGKRRLLDDINLTVLPREFVAVVGGSGAGKSTLMNALIGLWPGKGEVLLNGRDLYRDRSLRDQFGYVPQADILHLSLSVEKALDYAARLRLPSDVTRAERKERITRALETVGMNSEVLRRTRVSRLSGGQRKRVSIAAELLADPRLFFLDEATSGLDPGLEKKMMHTLRRMADEGRTVFLITHATANIVQADHVAFLADGRLVYFGPPKEALAFFGVEDFADIYERIDNRGEEWQRVFAAEKPEHHQRYIVDRQATRPAPPGRAGRGARRGIGFLRQLSVLTRRTLSVLTSDLLTLALLLLLFPLTATLQLVISTPDILTGDLAILADPVAAALTRLTSYVPLPGVNTFVFVMGLEAVLVGMYVPSNELIRERAIYLRERMVNLKIPPYLLSKVTVFLLFAAIQTALYLLVLSLGVHFPARGQLLPFVPEMFITLFLTLAAGIGIGLLVSAIGRSSDMAIYLLVILMFFEFFFAGTVFDLRGNPAEPLSYTTATRWSLTAIGVSIDMPRLAESTILCSDLPDNPLTPADDPRTVCENYPEARDDLMLPYQDDRLVQSWAVLAGMTIVTVLATGILIRRLDRAAARGSG